MKEPKKVNKALSHFHEIIEILDYYMPTMHQDLQKKLINIEETIRDLAIDRKEYNKRLIPRLKARWEKEHKESD